MLLYEQHLQKYEHYSTLPKPTPGTSANGAATKTRVKHAGGGRQRALPKAFHSVHSSTGSITSTLAQARIPPIREDSISVVPSPPHPSSPTQTTTTETSGNDPFNVFYDSLQEMLSRLTHPLAFATAPLDGVQVDFGNESFFMVENAPNNIINENVNVDANGNMSTKTIEEYSLENKQLKITLDHLSRKLASYKEVPPNLVSSG